MDTSFWTDPKILALPPHGKLFMTYLVTNPHSHVSGIYYLPGLLAEHETGLTKRALDTLRHTLPKARLAFFDTPLSIVWVRRMFHYQGRGEKNERAAAAQLANLHGSKLIAAFLAEYPRVAARCPEYPIAGVSGVGTPDQDQDQEQDQEQEEDRSALVRTKVRTTAVEEIEWRLEETWQAHLRAWNRFYSRENGKAPTNPPTRTPEIERAIRSGLRLYDAGLLLPEQRDQWKRESKVKAAGIGIFLSDWHTGHDPKNDTAVNGKRYLQSWRPWTARAKKGCPIEEFADLYFEQKAKQ